jgi:hypothetical protein
MEEQQQSTEEESPQGGGYEIYYHEDQGNVYLDGSGPYNPDYLSDPNDPLRPQETTDYTQQTDYTQ